jgi:hypothetical protein
MMTMMNVKMMIMKNKKMYMVCGVGSVGGVELTPIFINSLYNFLKNF